MGNGPSTKETTLHHYRDPMTRQLVQDSEIDLMGIIVAATSDDNEHKFFVARRIGALVEAMQADGAIVSIDSWGNCHIDFAAVMESIGEKNISVVGVTFVGTQAAFVVTNSYMKSIIDLNKTSEGIETCVVGQNTTNTLDAVKAAAILKNKIRKQHPERDWAVTGEARRRRLIRRSFGVDRVESAGQTEFSNKTLRLDLDGLVEKCMSSIKEECPQVKKVNVSLIAPHQHDTYVNAILDFSPIAAKVAGRAGEGITHLLTGVQVMLTAVEEGGFQPSSIGAADGILREKVLFGTPTTPAAEDCIIHVDVLLAEGQGRTREGIMAAHQACDVIVQEIRNAIRGLNNSQAEKKEELWDTAKTGGYKLVLVKLVSGLGCLYDTSLFPAEPGGYLGSKSIMDRSNNVQIVITPNEYQDGVLRALT